MKQVVVFLRICLGKGKGVDYLRVLLGDFIEGSSSMFLLTDETHSLLVLRDEPAQCAVFVFFSSFWFWFLVSFSLLELFLPGEIERESARL